MPRLIEYNNINKKMFMIYEETGIPLIKRQL